MKDAFSLIGAALVAALAFSCVGCGGSSDDSEATRLSRNRALWTSRGITHYSFTVQRSCFCIPEHVRPVNIEVEDGTVKSITYEDNMPADPATFAAFDTVEELFGEIEQAIDQGSTLRNVTYDETLGYLKTASIDWIPEGSDDEVSYTITNLTSLYNPE